MLARIALLNKQEFQRVLHAVVSLFAQDRRLLELRGSLIIRNLCTLLNAKSIYNSIAAILKGADLSGPASELSDLSPGDLEFRSIMVQTLNLILLTARELDELRVLLRFSLESDASSEATDLFVSIYGCWCHNPVATLALCLVAQAYDLASALVKQFSEIDVTVGFLMQLDKLVQLIESPIFIQLRLQLLEVTSAYHTPLLKSLYGVLMLLPQSTAFRTLSTRLATVATLQRHMHAMQIPVVTTPHATRWKQELLVCFQQVQLAHARALQQSASRNLDQYHHAGAPL